MTTPQETGRLYGVANRLEREREEARAVVKLGIESVAILTRERDEARAELDRIRGAFLTYAELMETTADHLAPNADAKPAFYRMVAKDVRRILGADLPHQESPA